MASDRIFGLVTLFVALAYIASATQIQTSFLADPVGSKSFPILIGVVAALSAIVLIIKPDPDPAWPQVRTWAALLVAVVVLVAYAYALKPLGFVIPTAIAAGILSYQISGRAAPSAIAGAGLAVGLFVLFRFALGLSLVALPKGWI
ncbi:tripartite tricarboxylate transporter TctB family protein [Sulfitobacter sp. SK012]|uniref:tripartite tricarboxylate transporter TctB family protein n=1 Tax=Sulfitobacter sp. SK012 TaxID=1389005 RepID=UPI000E0BFEE9|nr:tripartite tricarboxylate transporter TctB family protein [Sulfitobacter sp. SK012]AXI46555.1 tripartite tricarboxylate transporter TctB family protein [Sulfitobacter sp. SK012]